MRHYWKNAPHLENAPYLTPLKKCGHLLKSAAHLEKCNTLWKMRHIWKSGTFGQVANTWKNRPLMERWVKFRKERVTLGKNPLHLEKASHLGKWVTLENISHTCNIEGHTWTELCNTFKKESLLKKWVTMGRTGSHLEKRITLWKMGRTGKKLVIPGKRMTLRNWTDLEKGYALKTLVTFGSTWKRRSQLHKSVKLRKKLSNLEKLSTFAWKKSRFKNWSHLEKGVKLGKMGHTCKGSPLAKWVNLWKMDHT